MLHCRVAFRNSSEILAVELGLTNIHYQDFLVGMTGNFDVFRRKQLISEVKAQTSAQN